MREKPSVLVVDDLALNRLMVSVALRQLGCEVVEAGDGEEALLAIDGAVFDLVVMDCQMPVMDGLTATRHIRASHPGVPVLAYTTEDNREDCLAAGMSDYLAKPAPFGVLKAKLELWLERPQAAA